MLHMTLSSFRNFVLCGIITSPFLPKADIEEGQKVTEGFHMKYCPSLHVENHLVTHFPLYNDISLKPSI